MYVSPLSAGQPSPRTEAVIVCGAPMQDAHLPRKVKLSGLEMHQSHRGGKGWACPRPHTQEPAEPQPTGTGNQQ